MSNAHGWVNLADPSFSNLRTDWEKVALAKGTTPESADARREMADRYRSAAYLDFLAIVRERDTAHDLAQGFLVEFIEGKVLPRAGPETGSFRDVIKGSIRNHTHAERRRESRRRTDSLAGVDLPDPQGSPDAEFDRAVERGNSLVGGGDHPVEQGDRVVRRGD